MALSDRSLTAAAGAVALGVYVARQSAWFAGWEPMPQEVLSFVTAAVAFCFSWLTARPGDPAAEAREGAARAVETAPDGIARAELAAAIRGGPA